MTLTYPITKEEKENSEVALTGTLPKDLIETHAEKALDAISREVEVSGFRKGKAPKERVIEEVGKDFVWKQAAERALHDDVENILKQENVHPIMPLTTVLPNVEHGTDVAFEIRVVVPPKVSIENPKEIASNALSTLPKEDTEKELAEAKGAFRTQVRAVAKMKDPENVKEGDAKENEDKKDEALTDDEAKKVGFENAQAVEHFIDGEAKKAVTDRALQKKRASVAEALIEKSTYSVPAVMVADEARALLEAFKKDVVAQNMEWSEYLKRTGKNETQLADEFKPQAEKRIALDLVFAQIIKDEQFELTDEEKKQEDEFVGKLTEQGVDEGRARAYAHEQFLREKVWSHFGVKSPQPS